jgi:hypothetical protein
MKFRLDFDIKKLSTPITHHHNTFLIGSCFTENMGEKLRQYKFQVLENPNGIMFNPVSVAQTITDCIEHEEITADDLFELNEGWHSWKHHSRFSGLTIEESVQKINSSTIRAHEYLKKADHVMITLGSSWVYALSEKAPGSRQGFIVANNHKAPSEWFNRRLLTTEEVLQVLDNMIHRLFHFNKEVKIIFTISPVRHVREGVIENNRSKAVLIQAVHHLVNKFDRLYYFPSYELVLDDLRDYRFYSEDLVHPNYYATQYVWEKFVEACMNPKTKQLIEQIHSINLAFKHKPFNPSSQPHLKFLKSYLEKTKTLQQQHPYLDFEKEIEFFKKDSEK